MASLRGREVERRVDGQGFAELLAALSFAVCRAMDEGQVLVCARELLVAQALLDRVRDARRGSGGVAGFMRREREREGCRSGLEGSEDGAPHRMADLGGRKVEVRIDAQGLAEFLAAGAPAV